jgi:hypothetical protein
VPFTVHASGIEGALQPQSNTAPHCHCSALPSTPLPPHRSAPRCLLPVDSDERCQWRRARSRVVQPGQHGRSQTACQGRAGCATSPARRRTGGDEPRAGRTGSQRSDARPATGTPLHPRCAHRHLSKREAARRTAVRFGLQCSRSACERHEHTATAAVADTVAVRQTSVASPRPGGRWANSKGECPGAAVREACRLHRCAALASRHCGSPIQSRAVLCCAVPLCSTRSP